MTLFALTALLCARALAADAPQVSGCAQQACDARSTGVMGLPLPRTPPPFNFTLLPASNTTLSSPGCISNLNTVLCGVPMGAGTAAGSWGGGVFFTASGALRSAAPSPALAWCSQDASFAGRGVQLGIMSVQGDAAVWGPSHVALLGADGGARWLQPLSPPSPCNATSTGLASVALASSSTLNFGRELGLVFNYYSDGIPDAALSLRANASSSDLPSALGYLLPLASTTDGALRTLYIARFYMCQPSPSNDCSDLAHGAGAPPLQPTPELRLVAMDVRRGSPADPRRMVLPWKNLGPPLFSPLPASLAACTPSAAAPREPLAASALVLADGATLVAALACLGRMAAGASAPLELLLAAYTVSGGGAGAERVWRSTVNATGFWSAALQPPAQPPQLLQDAAVPHLAWLTAGGGSAADSAGNVRLLALNTSTGGLLTSRTLQEVLLAPPFGGAAAAASACPLPPLLLQHPASTLSFTAPSRAIVLEGAGGGALLLSVTLHTHSAAAAEDTSWLVALGTLGLPSAELLWCSSLPLGGFEGQFVAATRAQGGQPAASDTTIAGVTAGTKQIVGLMWW